VGFKKWYQYQISSKYAALEILHDNVHIDRALKNIRRNIKTSMKKSSTLLVKAA
jgi:hypothetical protein